MKYKQILLLIFFLNALNAQEGKILFLPGMDDAIFSRANIIENAKKELLITYYIWVDDESGMTLLTMLLDAKERNPDIEIKVIIDAFGKSIDRRFLYYCETKGIEFKVFNALPKLIVPPEKLSISNFVKAVMGFNSRLHEKVIIADGEQFITGGRNIRNSYFGFAKRNFNDLEAYFLSEQLTADVRSYFLMMWNSHYVTDITYFSGEQSNEGLVFAEEQFKEFREIIRTSRETLKSKYKDFNPQKLGIPFKKARFLSPYDPYSDHLDPVYLSTEFYNLMLATERKVLIETPYLLPTRMMYNTFEYLISKGVKIEFVTNSICSNDIMAVTAPYDNQKERILKLGAEIYEFKGPDYLHSKAGVFDDKIAYVSTFNLNPRSEKFNTELIFIIEDENVAEKLTELINVNIANSVKIGEKGYNGWPGLYECDKTSFDLFIYMTFHVLTRFSFVYALF